MAKPGMAAALEERLEEKQYNLSGQGREERIFEIFLKDSMMALPVLKETEELLDGFELVQGSMDDVFLNITGKNLEEM